MKKIELYTIKILITLFLITFSSTILSSLFVSSNIIFIISAKFTICVLLISLILVLYKIISILNENQ